MIVNVATWLSYGGLACCLLLAVGVFFRGVRKKRASRLSVAMTNTQPSRRQRKGLPLIPGRISGASTMNEQLPRRQPGVPAPFVYNEATPWGWLEYRNGNFLGQELALKRALVSIGRETDNEVELDDDTISRYHAELAWLHGQVYVTDNGSLNGVQLNGRRIQGSLPVKHGDVLGIGTHLFLMKYARQPSTLDEMDDPLLKYIRKPGASACHSDVHLSTPPAARKPLSGPTRVLPSGQTIAYSDNACDIPGQETCEPGYPPEPGAPKMLESLAPSEEPLSLKLPGHLRLPGRLIE